MLENYGVDNPGKLIQSRIKVIERNKQPKTQATIERQRQSLTISGKVRGSNNAMFGRSGELAPCYGRTGEAHPMFGTSHTEDALNKLRSNANLKKPKTNVTCPHCNKTGGKPVMTRYHFDKCKKAIHV